MKYKEVGLRLNILVSTIHSNGLLFLIKDKISPIEILKLPFTSGIPN